MSDETLQVAKSLFKLSVITKMLRDNLGEKVCQTLVSKLLLIVLLLPLFRFVVQGDCLGLFLLRLFEGKLHSLQLHLEAFHFGGGLCQLCRGGLFLPVRCCSTARLLFSWWCRLSRFLEGGNDLREL